MNEKNNENQIGDIAFHWRIPEYEKHERSRAWYIGASIIAFLLMIYSFFTANFLFSVILIIVSIVVVLHDGQNPMLVDIFITTEGVLVGRKFYDYDELKDFSVVYKKNQNVKNLYFEFKNTIKPRISIPLFDINPVKLRTELLKYLKEDLERTDQSTSEGLAKIFKL